MANLKLKNKLGVVQLYPNITQLKLPNVDGTSTTYTEGDLTSISKEILTIGTEVPNFGYINTIYFNTSIPVTEVVEILKGLTYISTPLLDYPIAPILVTTDSSKALFALKYEDDGDTYYEIHLATDFANQISELIFSAGSWPNNYTGFNTISYKIESSVTNNFSGLSVGAENSKLSSIISAAPFIVDRTDSKSPSGVYTGVELKISSNRLVDIEARMDLHHEIPLYIDVTQSAAVAGNKEVTTVGITDVTNFETAQVVETNLIPENLKLNTNILGVIGNKIPLLDSQILSKLSLQTLIDVRQSVENIFYNDTRPQLDFLTTLDLSGLSSISKMFYGCTNLESISYLDTSNITDMSYTFYNCSKLESIPQLDSSKVTTMDYMFSGCTNLTTIPLLATSNVTNMRFMFNDCSNLTSIPQLDTSNVTDMYYMFGDCTNLTTIPLLNTQKVTDMRYMFDYCSNLTSIPQLATSNVTTMGCMFRNCSSLTSIPQLNTSNVTSLGSMFQRCRSLTSIPQLDTSNVTNMYNMFENCSSLTTIPLLNTSNVTDMSYMFENCSSLTEIPQLDTSKVTNMEYMFRGCSKLQEVKLDNSGVNNKNSGFKHVFSNCYKLELIDLTNYYSYYPSRDYSNQYGKGLFNNCYSLKHLIIRNIGEKYCIANKWSMHNPVASDYTFNNCYHFFGTSHSLYNPSGLKDGKIYAPRSQVDLLINDTYGWANDNFNFRVLEDYTIDGTTTGEFNRALAEAPEVHISSYNYSVSNAGLGYYSLDEGQTWVDLSTITFKSVPYGQSYPEIIGANKIKFKIAAGASGYIRSTSLGFTLNSSTSKDVESSVFTLTADLTDLYIAL